MKISKKMQNAINKQINAELYSSYLYLSMAACFEAGNLKGFAHWMGVQAKEEYEHAMKFYAYVNERLGRVTLAAIDAPPTEWASAVKAFEDVAAHEEKVTASIASLADLAAAEKDHATSAMLQWFITEQVEEEANADEILQQLRMVGDSKNGLLMLDHQLAKRE